MRLGAPIQPFDSPETWVRMLQNAGFRAAYCPVSTGADSATVQAYRMAALANDIVIAEVGVWNNPLSVDSTSRHQAIAQCQQSLALADEIGARCCVNIAGSRGDVWDGPHPDNFSADTFDLIVETVRHIIDAVKPGRTFYTLEPMPWVFPDSPDSYLDLIRAIDRPQFGVHFDPVNMISGPRRYFDNAAFMNECFSKLGRFMKSCHAKDITLHSKLTVHLDEVRPGLGSLNYPTLLRGINRLDDVPVMLEHLPSEDYPAAAAFVRSIAHALTISL